MDLVRMLEDLRAEHDRLSQAIAVVTRLAAGSGVKRRGRPPAWLQSAGASAGETTTTEKPKGTFSAATRAKMKRAQKKRWAAIKKQAA
jgi:hypothetical protein